MPAISSVDAIAWRWAYGRPKAWVTSFYALRSAEPARWSPESIARAEDAATASARASVWAWPLLAWAVIGALLTPLIIVQTVTWILGIAIALGFRGTPNAAVLFALAGVVEVTVFLLPQWLAFRRVMLLAQPVDALLLGSAEWDPEQRASALAELDGDAYPLVAQAMRRLLH